MTIHAYTGVSQQEIKAERTNSEGKFYTLNHPNDLLVSMRYNGEHCSSSNSQGWDRNSSYYFENLQHNHPEFFSNKNVLRINNGQSPKVDAQFVKYFPQYKGYENELLVHHHIGKDGQAVAIPASIHKGSGEIHLIENELGITTNAQRFSGRCKLICEKDPSYFGNTSEQFRALGRQQLTDMNAVARVSRKGHINSPSQKNAFTKFTNSSSQEMNNNNSQHHNGITRVSHNILSENNSPRGGSQNLEENDVQSKSIDSSKSR